MLTIKTTTERLKSILNLMSLYTSNRIVFTPIAPMVYPDHHISLIGRSKSIIYFEAFNLQVSGITEPTRIPLSISSIMPHLAWYQPADPISLSYDNINKEIKITDLADSGVKDDVTISSVDIVEIYNKLDEFPLTLDDNGNPLFRGTIETTIHATIDTSLFKAQISKANTVKSDPAIFYLDFCPDNLLIMKVGNPTSREQDKIKSEVTLTNLVGTGSCAYSLDFSELFNTLTGNVNISTIPGGPLWVTQQTPEYHARYLLSPATITETPT
jgi:hypothetical protein